MLEWWATSWEKVIAVVGALAGVIGVYFGSKGWKRRKPTYLIRSNNIFSGLEHTVPDVEVKFPGYGQPIKALTVSKIAFWNDGNETIRKQDIVKDDPITIQGKEGIVFLSVSVIESVSPLNKIECKMNQDRSLVTITFEYLDHNQGANIQVFHTGTSNADITLRGTIMGASPIRRKLRGNSPSPPPPIWMGPLMLSVLWVVWGLFRFGVLPTSSTPEPYQPVAREPITVEAAGIGLLIVTIGFAIVHYLTYIPKPFSNIQRQ
jgi:hypothetical protein